MGFFNDYGFLVQNTGSWNWGVHYQLFPVLLENTYNREPDILRQLKAILFPSLLPYNCEGENWMVYGLLKFSWDLLRFKCFLFNLLESRAAGFVLVHGSLCLNIRKFTRGLQTHQCVSILDQLWHRNSWLHLSKWHPWGRQALSWDLWSLLPHGRADQLNVKSRRNQGTFWTERETTHSLHFNNSFFSLILSPYFTGIQNVVF